MKVAEIEKLANPIEGFLSQNGRNQFEGEVLYRLALKSKGKIVEIGSWKGKSTIWLGKGSEAGYQQKIYAIDPHLDSEEHRSDGKPVWTFEAFQENISHADVSKFVVPVVKEAREGIEDVPGRVGLVFIDGLHDYELLKNDFTAWLPKIEIGGTIAFHDSFGRGCPGVRRLVHDEIFKSPNFKNVRYINGITYATKVELATFSDRLKNKIALLIKMIHEKSLELPQPCRTIAKKLIWRPFQKKWLKDLNK